MNFKPFTFLRYSTPLIATALLVSCEDAAVDKDNALDDYLGSLDKEEDTDDDKEPDDQGPIVTSRPNIVLMLADDMGFDDMSYRGNKAVDTPHLDYLASISTRFEDFYVHSVSAPTRASLLTGRHFLRAGVSGVHAGRDYLNLDEVTIADALSDAGYKTGMWGKWHSGTSNGYHPWQRGFDEAYSASLYHHQNNSGLYCGPYDGKNYSGTQLNLKGWTDENMTDMAIDFMKRNRKNNFFAYIPYLAAHASWEAPAEYIEPYSKKGQSDNFAALNGMLSHLDNNVGRVMDALESLGLMENTIVIFMSDNGPNYSGVGDKKLTDAEWEERNPSGYRGSKARNLENGIHSPLFIYWKGRMQAIDNHSLLSVVDLFPTLCDAAGASIPSDCKPLDGKSFYNLFAAPQITDKSRTLYISHWSPFFSDKYMPDGASDSEVVLTPELIESIDPELQHIGIRKGDDKVLMNEYTVGDLGFWNLANDPRETNNLCESSSSTNMSKALAYKAELLAWYKDVLADDGSLTIPTFPVGYKNIDDCEIPANAPASTSAGLKNETHQLSGFNVSGESATYNIDVQREGYYYLRLKTLTNFKSGPQIFSVSTNVEPYCGDVVWAGNVVSKLVTVHLTKDVKSITVQLKGNVSQAVTLKSVVLEFKE